MSLQKLNRNLSTNFGVIPPTDEHKRQKHNILDGGNSGSLIQRLIRLRTFSALCRFLYLMLTLGTIVSITLVSTLPNFCTAPSRCLSYQQRKLLQSPQQAVTKRTNSKLRQVKLVSTYKLIGYCHHRARGSERVPQGNQEL